MAAAPILSGIGGGSAGERERPGGSVVAAFDLDGTLTTGGSLFAFLRRLGGERAAASALAIELPRMARGALIGGTARDSAKESLIGRITAGLDEGTVREIADEFAGDLLHRRLRAAARERWDAHRQRGHQVVIVSASPELYVEAVGRRLGADAVLATRLEVDSAGRLTGRFVGRNCRGAEKAERLRSWMGESPGRMRSRVWAYGNSAGDAALLALADVGIRVGRRWPDLDDLDEPGHVDDLENEPRPSGPRGD